LNKSENTPDQHTEQIENKTSEPVKTSSEIPALQKQQIKESTSKESTSKEPTSKASTSKAKRESNPSSEFVDWNSFVNETLPQTVIPITEKSIMSSLKKIQKQLDSFIKQKNTEVI